MRLLDNRPSTNPVVDQAITRLRATQMGDRLAGRMNARRPPQDLKSVCAIANGLAAAHRHAQDSPHTLILVSQSYFTGVACRFLPPAATPMQESTSVPVHAVHSSIYWAVSAITPMQKTTCITIVAEYPCLLDERVGVHRRSKAGSIRRRRRTVGIRCGDPRRRYHDH